MWWFPLRQRQMNRLPGAGRGFRLWGNPKSCSGFGLGYSTKSQVGFTLAELLIALAILGEIATFTIPKIINAQQNQSFNAKGKETMASIADAFHMYALNNTVTSNTGTSDLTSYLNYVKVDTATSIDDMYNRSTTPRTCGSQVNLQCVQLHNGGILYWDTNHKFSGTTTTNVIDFIFDPDGKVTDPGGTLGPGHSLNIMLYYNGRVTTRQNMDTSCGSWSCPFSAANQDPAWFSL